MKSLFWRAGSSSTVFAVNFFIIKCKCIFLAALRMTKIYLIVNLYHRNSNTDTKALSYAKDYYSEFKPLFTGFNLWTQNLY